MRDMDETKVRDELFELVRDVDVRPGLERRTIGRARRRRALMASATAVVVVGLVAASYTGIRAVLGERTEGRFGGDDPSPTVPSPVPSPTPSSSVSEPTMVTPPPVNVDGVPPTTAETARQIYVGVLNLDFARLESLLDPMIFVYNFDDGSNPIPEWRSEPAVLDPIPAILTLSPTPAREIEGYGTFYFWPYLYGSDFSNLTEQEREDLATLGFSEGEIEDMIQFGGYLGPRLAIDENGVWRNYVTGGD